MIVLNEVLADAALAIPRFVVGLGEEAAIIPVNRGFDEDGSGDWRLDELGQRMFSFASRSR